MIHKMDNLDKFEIELSKRRIFGPVRKQWIDLYLKDPDEAYFRLFSPNIHRKTE